MRNAPLSWPDEKLRYAFGMRTQLYTLSTLFLACACASEPTSPAPGVKPIPDGDFDGLTAVEWVGGSDYALHWTASDRPVTVEARAEDGTVLGSWSTLEPGASVTVAHSEVVAFVATTSDGAGAEQVLRQWPGENRLVEVGSVSFRGGMDVAGEGELAVLAGGMHPDIDALIVDLSDPRSPQPVGTIEGVDEIRDVHLEDGILYAASDCACMRGDERFEAWGGVGVRIYDLADPSRPELLATIGGDDASVHNLYVEDGLLYLVSLLDQQISIYDISDPASPTLTTRWTPPTMAGPHDVMARGRTAWVAGPFGLATLDLSDPTWADLTMIQTDADLDHPHDTGAPPPPPPPHGPDGEELVITGFHNVWPSEDGSVLYTSREILGGRLEVWDASDPSHVEPVSAWPAEELNCIHNVHAWGDYAFTAWYHDGLRVLDVSNPASPTLVGSVETNDHSEPPRDKPDIRGAWGIWPYGEYVIGGDTETGLWVAEFHPRVSTRDGIPRAVVPAE